MAANKNETKADRERHLDKVAAMYCEGVKQYKIADALDVTPPQISYDMRILIARWEKASTRRISRWKAQELEKINYRESVLWEAWHTSCESAVKVSKSKSVGSDVVTNRQEVTAPGGDMRIMAGIEKCCDQRCKLLGLYNPIQVERKDVKIDYASLTTPQLLARQNGMSWDEVLAMEPDNGS